jgi:NhaP-type Na+/H+ or K+/H+ antiporter
LHYIVPCLYICVKLLLHIKKRIMKKLFLTHFKPVGVVALTLSLLFMVKVKNQAYYESFDSDASRVMMRTLSKHADILQSRIFTIKNY